MTWHKQQSWATECISPDRRAVVQVIASHNRTAAAENTGSRCALIDINVNYSYLGKGLAETRSGALPPTVSLLPCPPAIYLLPPLPPLILPPCPLLPGPSACPGLPAAGRTAAGAAATSPATQGGCTLPQVAPRFLPTALG